VQLAGYKLHFVGDALVHVRFQETASKEYRQAREWGEHNVKLYKMYRPLGMPKISWKRGVLNWCQLLLAGVDLAIPKKRARWLWRFNWNFGRLLGCLKYRVLAP
jgi:cellulose synthase/poly-beta-1,6-N-acetylglucosamine synthase-like glycosyltransferase